ncbi:MAG: NAD(P)/FAD-dependent oxidoreductase [Acidobacteria bacterium]|nr:MAG: NAD(P)/FAD-dependent oxidoreductase [Acidobacteriota bacterium]
MQNENDAIVVGAGPAGATAARALALGGARVCLLERSRFPRNKPCGGGITVRALRRFPWLEPALGRIPTHYVSRLVLEGASGASVTLTSSRPAVLLIRRFEFDNLLTRLAVESGADLVEQAWVSSVDADENGANVRTRDGREFRAPFLIAADGVNGVTTRRLGLHHGWGADSIALDMMEETPNSELRAVDPATLWVSYGRGGADGYGYIFPKRDHVNVGIGCLLSHFREHVVLAPHEMQQQFVDDLTRRGALDGNSSPQHFTPFHIPVGGPIGKTARERVVVAGDAGGFVNAYTAEGIYYAMVTGELAANSVLAALSDRSPRAGRGLAKRYVRAWKREIGSELRDSVLIQKYLFADANRIEAVVRGASCWPELAQAIIAYASGDLSYKEARRRLLRQFPRAALNLLGTGFHNRSAGKSGREPSAP